MYKVNLIRSQKNFSSLLYPWIFALSSLTLLLIPACENIFSPSLDESSSGSIITDQMTVEGLYQNFRYAYTFKDTSVYSNLLTEDFIFIYRDYTSGFDISWDKTTEMRTTSGLFSNSQKLELIWNNIIFQSGDSLQQNIKRSFNLTITFNPNDIVRLNGFADMTLKRISQEDKWRISKWRDESF